METPIGQLAETVKAMVGARSVITYHPLPGDDPLQRCPDITRARTTLDWAPEVDLATGLARTIAYFRDLIAA